MRGERKRGTFRSARQAADLGVRHVQFIGGEPTIHPDIAQLVRAARDMGLEVEVYSNLTHIPPHLWDLFTERQVGLATSFYSRHEQAHDVVTNGRGSQNYAARAAAGRARR